MDTWVWVVIGAAAVLVLVLAGWGIVSSNRRRRLQERFGPEYERLMAERGDRRETESELRAREERREQLDIRPLDPAMRDRYATAWRQIQTRFVDDPALSVKEADQLVTDVMRDRGYPIEDFDQRSADISVDYPIVVENYRSAQAISIQSAEGRAETEDLRQAMVHYRSLFSELLETGDGNGAGPEAEEREGSADVDSGGSPVAGRSE